MTINLEADHLENVALFAGIERDRLRLLALTAIEPVTYEADTVLFCPGDPAEYAYVVVAGMVEVLLDIGERQEVVAKVGKDGLVGMTSLLCDRSRRATARVAEPLRALRISKETFDRLLAECPDVTVKILRTLVRQQAAVIEALLHGHKPPPAV